MWGCGDSEPLPDPMLASLDGYAAALVEWLAGAGVKEVVGVGCSMGGYVLFSLLRRAPELLRGLVLVSTRAGADTPEQAANRRKMAELALRDGAETAVPMANRLLGPQAREEPHIRDSVEGRIRRCRPDGIAACQMAMAARPDSTGLLGSVDIPTLVIAGEQDAIIGLDEARAMAEALPQAELQVIPQVGHLPNLEDHQAFTEALAGFLNRLAAG